MYFKIVLPVSCQSINFILLESFKHGQNPLHIFDFLTTLKHNLNFGVIINYVFYY